MWISDKWQDFELIDCSRGEKLERWGSQILVRPDPQAIWDTPRLDPGWKQPSARYSHSSTGGGHWDKQALPESWQISYGELRFNVRPMNFKHTGLFPEQASNWDYIMDKIRSAGRPGVKCNPERNYACAGERKDVRMLPKLEQCADPLRWKETLS